MSLSTLRREYNFTALRRRDLEPDPIAQFRGWFAQASGTRRSGRVRKLLVRTYRMAPPSQAEANAATLATADRSGNPSARTVLLKHVDERGFVFFTNYGSRKGRDLAENPRATLVFYWPDQARQVCISGVVSKVPREESEAYFKSRPRGSQLAACASRQSEVAAGRSALDQRWEELEKQYSGKDIPMPSNWGGYVLAPTQVEFWQGRLNRLHDRFRYSRQPGGTWVIERLHP